MGWFSALLSVDKAADNILDKDKGLLAKAGQWVGKLNFTEEELRGFTIDYLKAMAPFKVMQRIMVTIIMLMWAILGLNIILAIWIQNETIITNLMNLAMTEFMWMPVIGAVSLYLLGGVWPTKK